MSIHLDVWNVFIKIISFDYCSFWLVVVGCSHFIYWERHKHYTDFYNSWINLISTIPNLEWTWIDFSFIFSFNDQFNDWTLNQCLKYWICTLYTNSEYESRINLSVWCRYLVLFQIRYSIIKRKCANHKMILWKCVLHLIWWMCSFSRLLTEMNRFI